MDRLDLVSAVLPLQPQLLALAVILSQPAEPSETGLEGRWRNPSGSVIISITQCEQSFCGRVQWASDKAVSDARRGGTDPLVGAKLLTDIVPRGKGRWSARLFVPDIHKTSRAKLRLLGLDQLKVTGCAAGRIICKSQVWTRATAE
jgi:uncharacterized protein (DUF2147 family)